ncbi:hypothetical protein SLS62_008503 [Diatrype stigma]|uniref:N-acetyltransferase domain-containing protein n=1 Tax=Diatrype stigma TaxID=117547 RepID=A0AAN9UHH9_9PEZI
MASSSSSAVLGSGTSSTSTSTDVVLSWVEPGDVKECIGLIMDVTGDQDPMRVVMYEDAKHEAHTLATVAWMYEEMAETESDVDKIVKAVRVRDGRIVGVLHAGKTSEGVARRVSVSDGLSKLKIESESDADTGLDAGAGAVPNPVPVPIAGSVTGSGPGVGTDAGNQHTRPPVPEDLLNKSVAELTDEDCHRINAWAVDGDLLADEMSIRKGVSEAAKPLGPLYNINVVAIAPDARGQGIGTRLLEYLRQEHTDSIGFGLVAHCGRNTRGFFEKSGFEFKGEEVSKTGQERLWLWSPAVPGRGKER